MTRSPEDDWAAHDVANRDGSRQRIVVDLLGGVGTIILNNSHHHNALDWDDFAALHASVRTLSSEPQCSVIILSGAGQSFCSGIDMSVASTGVSEDPVAAGELRLKAGFNTA